MNSDERQTDREASILAEERRQVYHDHFKLSKKHESVALKRKMDTFETQMVTIRARLEARRELVSPQRNVHLPAVTSSPQLTSIAAESTSSTDRLKLPLLRQIERTRVANAPPKDPFLEVENVLHRTFTREMYVRDADNVAAKELAAVSMTKEAQQLGEEARKRMMAYTQNESGWRFEVRTSRYQQVMELKQQAEKAQQHADSQRETARQLKSLLRDPYEDLRSSPVSRAILSPTPSSFKLPRKRDSEWIWMLASPSTKLSFTPREESPEFVMESEKELSMYVVYYIAASEVNSLQMETEVQWQKAFKSDRPPTTGWICCSMHGVPPAPELVAVRSGIQTWAVAGAGAGHLNGKYVACGVHDQVGRFKSSAGVELFRKCVPTVSALSQVLHAGETARSESASPSARDEEALEREGSSEVTTKAKPSIVLPSGLASIEKEELNFRSMQRFGSWLSMNEAVERNRRMHASRRTAFNPDQVAASHEGVKLDGSSVMKQECREVKGSSDVVDSRPEVAAPLCREWVLFTRCSRRPAEKSSSGASDPPIRGIGLGCLKRHYYISLEEKAEMTSWVQTKESWLEKKVLAVVIEREAQMERVHHLSRKCMVRYQQNLREATDKSKMKLLAELNRVRFLTVKVLETIDRWRQHARKIGFARYDSSSDMTQVPNGMDVNASNEATKNQQTEAPLLGWSSSITLETGKQLYKGSRAFVSKVKRFRRSEDVDGKREQHIVYLGYFETQEEAERAYDDHAASEARRLNTTVEHLPRRRNVFRSCGKHFAVESEKGGPSFCIECKTKQLASLSSAPEDEWVPPFFYGTGVNYIMKMANDLDFLDGVLPLKAALNDGRGVEGEAFPMRGNIFLLPKTPIQDPDLAVFTSFPTPTAPRLGESTDSSTIDDIDDEALDRIRIFKAQQIFLQELQIYQPVLIAESLAGQCTPSKFCKTNQESSTPQFRLVEALYWDHCAALKVLQERPPLALRQPNIWCRPDAGEWSSLVVRGAHRLHFLFEEKLEKSGKEMARRRQQVLTALRQLNKVPLYFVPSRTSFTDLIAAGENVRGDVVQLEVNNATKRLQRYDSWCSMSLVVQRWFRGVLGRRRARATRKALRLVCKLRVLYADQVAAVAKAFYESDVCTEAVRQAYKTICTPVYTRVVMTDGELVTITFHSLRHFQPDDTIFENYPAPKKTLLPSYCCAGCARKFHVKSNYQLRGNKFKVFRGVCTCSLNGGRSQEGSNDNESWLIRAYNSSHNVIYRLRLDASQLQQLVTSQAHSKVYPQLSKTNVNSLIGDMETKQLAAAAASIHTAFCIKSAERAAQIVTNWRRMNSEATHTRKSLMIALDKNLALLDRTKYAHAVSVGNAKKALNFASRPFSEAQAWDPLENANDWRFIVEKRQLVKRLEEVHQEVERLRVAHFQATYNDQFTRAGAARAEDDYNRGWLPLVERVSQAMQEAILRETTAKTRMESFMEQLCYRFLTLRDGYHVPTRRNLVVQSPVWHDMVPFRLDIPGLRRRLNHLRRRTLVLSNLTEQNRKTRRMIVTVSMWPLIASGNRNAYSHKRDLWVSAYDPIDCSVHNIFLEYELVRLLIGSSGKKLWQNSTESMRSAWRSVSDMILSLTMLDRFTGEFTLQKLQFYHTLRQLSPQFLSSRVMRDLQAGRKCGQGDEILRQGVSVDGRLCVVVVYENWGDLTFAIYHTASGDFFRLVMPLSQVFDLLSNKPLMLRLWVCCVKSNSYTPTLLAYLLKHVRFYRRDDDGENVRIETGLPAQKRLKRYQTVLQIQNRKVLFSIAEDSSGDFFVFGYDVKNELTYKLLLERGSLHRFLKTSALTGGITAGVQTRPSSLLLRRNRKLLLDWICSHLRFQSMLEHPEIVTSGTSSLLFGLHLRESFRIFNRWIDSSPRNPLHTVSEVEITRWASTVDAAAFSSLHFDQLTLMGRTRIPFALEKEYAGTIDWVDAVATPLPRAPLWNKELPYMRMDFFVKAHRLFARVRGELEAEAIERRKRENWAGMEQEDYSGLRLAVVILMESAKVHISSTLQTLSDFHSTATKWIAQWRNIHLELRMATKCQEESVGGGEYLLAVENVIGMLQEDSATVFVESLHTWIPDRASSFIQFLTLAVPLASWCPVVAAARILQVCQQRWNCEIKSKLLDFELVFEKIERSEDCLEELRKHKARVVQFCNFLDRQAAPTTGSDENEGDKPQHEHEDTTADVIHEIPKLVILPEAMSTHSVVNTGAWIPTNCNEPIQEIFLTGVPEWTPSRTSSFLAYAQAMVKQLRSVFKQQWIQQQIPGSLADRNISNTNGILTCQRVPHGVLVYQQISRVSCTKTQVSQLNSRAAALVGGVGVYGPALFWPLQTGISWYQRMINCSVVCTKLAANVDELELEVALTRPAAIRSTKYLPWKQFALERLHIARAVKRSRSSEAVFLDSLPETDDEAEKEERMITSVVVDFRQLEITLGKRSGREFRGNVHGIQCMRHLFELQKDFLQDGSVRWQASIANPREMHQVLDIYDADGRAVPIPCARLISQNVLKMKNVQVELDDAVKPRRLIFSYHDLQTQRQYFADCDYHTLQSLVRQRTTEKESPDIQVSVPLHMEAKWRHSSSVLNIQELRRLATLASQFLVFRQKNGVLSLCLEVYSPEMSIEEGTRTEVLSGESFQGEDRAVVEDDLVDAPGNYSLQSREVENPLVHSDTDHPALPAPSLPVQRRCRANILEEHKAVKSTTIHHFQKHQPAIRAAACGRILARAASPSGSGIRTASEWMQMTREDWCAQELRGMLVLEANVLTTLETAYTPATRRAREYLKSSNKEMDSGGLELQLREIGKAMGTVELQSIEAEILQSIRMARWRRRGKEAIIVAKRAEAHLSDVAEWWRRRSPSLQPETK